MYVTKFGAYNLELGYRGYFLLYTLYDYQNLTKSVREGTSTLTDVGNLKIIGKNNQSRETRSTQTGKIKK